MNSSSGEPMDPFASLEIQRCCEILGSPTQDELDRGLDGFLTRIPADKAHRSSPWRRWCLLGTAAAVLIASPVLWRHVRVPEAPTLSYRIDGGHELESGYLREAGHAGIQVLFNEGSRFDLTPGARGRIRAVDRSGAHLALELGTASLHITPGAPRRWLVDVGPFLVTVKGTVFTVSWDPSNEQFELQLQRGQVVVNGPVSAGEIALRAGQRLAVNLAASETIISEDPAPGQAGAAVSDRSPTPTGAVIASPAPGPARASLLPAAAKPAVADHRWREHLARGNWERILDEVGRLGVSETLNKASSEDLFALSNAARYHHEFDLARSALLAERRRFPGSPRALDALYLLGRVEESHEAGTAQAIAWYDEYLAHAPHGPLVGEALGRKMILTERLAGPERARAVADDYLRRFPKGNYAGWARELLTP